MFNSLVIGWFLAFGWVPQQDAVLGHQRFEIDDDKVAFNSAIGIDLTIDDRFRIFTDVENYQYKDKRDFRFNPYRVDYTFGLEYTVNKFVEVTAVHECIHDVKYKSGQPQGYQGSETKVFVKIHGETRLK